MKGISKNLLRGPIVGAWVVLEISRATVCTLRFLRSIRLALSSLMTLFRGALKPLNRVRFIYYSSQQIQAIRIITFILRRHSAGIPTLELKQPSLQFRAARVSANPAVSSDNAMTRHDNRQWIPPASRPHRPSCARRAYGCGKLAIRGGFAVRYGQHRLPRPTRKVASRLGQRQRKLPKPTGKPRIKLSKRLINERRSGNDIRRFRRHKNDTRHHASALANTNRADRSLTTRKGGEIV